MKFTEYGPLTEFMQSTLSSLGFNPGKTDGIFGERTKSALLRFGKTAGRDGIQSSFSALLPYMRGYFEYETDESFEEISERFTSPLPLLKAANPIRKPKVTVPIRSSVVPTDVRYCSEILEFNLKSLAVRFPFVSLFSIGKSVLGKDLCCIKIGDGKKEIFYNGAHHADEWITSVILARFAEDFSAAAAYGTFLAGQNVRNVLLSSTLYILPCVNPDGVDLVTEAYPKGSAIRRDAKTMSDGENFPENWKANIVGVDLNLNYPAGWSDARDFKFSLGYTDPGPRGYVGPYPLSEPETKAMAAFTDRHPFELIIALHAQGKEIFPEYKGKSYKNAAEIAAKFAELSGYEVKATPAEMGNAGYKDWFVDKYERPGFTVEVGIGKNPLPVCQFGEIYRDVVGILASAPDLA